MWVEIVSLGKVSRSISATSQPRSASRVASVDPAHRAPTMTASFSLISRREYPRDRSRAREFRHPGGLCLAPAEVDAAVGEIWAEAVRVLGLVAPLRDLLAQAVGQLRAGLLDYQGLAGPAVLL